MKTIWDILEDFDKLLKTKSKGAQVLILEGTIQTLQGELKKLLTVEAKQSGEKEEASH
jgi:hypothetical protein